MKTLLLKFASFALLAVPVLLIGCGEDATDEKTQGPAPVLSVKLNETNTLNVSAAGSSRIPLLYEVENPVEGATVSVSSEDAWLHDFDTATAGQVFFVVDEVFRVDVFVDVLAAFFEVDVDRLVAFVAGAASVAAGASAAAAFVVAAFVAVDFAVFVALVFAAADLVLFFAVVLEAPSVAFATVLVLFLAAVRFVVRLRCFIRR